MTQRVLCQQLNVKIMLSGGGGGELAVTQGGSGVRTLIGDGGRDITVK